MLTKSTFTNTPDIRAAAPGGSGAGHAASSPFWRRNAEASLIGRIQAINKINDPTIMTDNVLRWVKVALVILLAATGLIGALNYWKFFSLTLGNVYIVAFLTVAIAGLVEFGKYFATKWAIRYPFFNTFRAIFSEAHSTLIWVGLLLVAGLTFVLSAYNSTKGAEQLSYLIAHESAEGQAVFTPQTAEIDAQIANAQNVQASALSNRISTGKYKGMVDWQSSKTAKNAGASAATLIAQKQQIVEQQRQDWERQQGERSQNVNHAASYVLKIGGWLELLQFILMFVRVACEKQLASHPDAQPRPQHKPAPSPSNGPQFNGQPASDYHNNTYFNRGADGNVIRATAPQPYNPVAQPVPQDYITITDVRIVDAEKVLRHHRSEMSKWIGHFNRKDAPGTPDIVTRLLTDAHNDINRMGHGIEPEAVESFCDYVENRIGPKLADAGKPYAGMGVMLATLRGKSRRTDTPTAPIANQILARYERMEGASA